MEFKLKMQPQEVIKRAVEAVQYAKSLCDDVEFSCEDACRSDMGFLKEICDAAINAGASTINIPDTVGYLYPDEITTRIGEIVKLIGERAVVSVHNHNDLGMATVNSLAAILAGARQVECTINGIGERAGNAALEEIVMAIKTRTDKFAPLYTDINLKEIYPSSRLVASITGIEPQPNKAIVGKNAFAHESGIHQDGVLKHKETYEIMHAEDIGLDKNSLVLGKHSGRHAFKDKLASLGYELSNEQIEIAFNKFKALADSKKDVFDEDIRELVNDEFVGAEKTYEVLVLSSNSCNKGHASTALTLRYKDEILSDSALGNGGVDAIFKAIDRISGISGSLKDYQVKAVSQGKDALAKVTVKVEFAGEGAIIGRGLDVDTMLASAKAYVAALNTYLDAKR
jgi:2-isopropylmalate synthase